MKEKDAQYILLRICSLHLEDECLSFIYFYVKPLTLFPNLLICSGGWKSRNKTIVKYVY